MVVARGTQVLPAPDGNHFPTQRELVALLTGAGFELIEQIDQPSQAPLSWSQRGEQSPQSSRPATSALWVTGGVPSCARAAGRWRSATG